MFSLSLFISCRKHGPHLLHSERDFAPALFARIGKHGKMRSMDLDPLRLIFRPGGVRRKSVEQQSQSDEGEM